MFRPLMQFPIAFINPFIDIPVICRIFLLKTYHACVCLVDSSYFHLLTHSMHYHTIFNFTRFLCTHRKFLFKLKTSFESSSTSKYLYASLCWQNLLTWPTENIFERLFASTNFFKNANFHCSNIARDIYTVTSNGLLTSVELCAEWVCFCCVA